MGLMFQLKLKFGKDVPYIIYDGIINPKYWMHKEGIRAFLIQPTKGIILLLIVLTFLSFNPLYLSKNQDTTQKTSQNTVFSSEIWQNKNL